MSETEAIRVYDGAESCEHCKKCPVVDHLPESGQVVIHDPHKPENGKFTMSVEEYNALLGHARPIA
jgi:hypothetical protein